MATITVCDLCGKPITDIRTTCHYKVKRRWFGFPPDSGWDYITAHDSCVKKLLDAVDEPSKEVGEDG